MNEENKNNEIVSISLPQVESKDLSAKIQLFLKVTDSDIRNVTVHPESDTVESLKKKVKKTQAFPTEILEGMKIRLIYRGRIMLDMQSLSDYSKPYLEFLDRAYIHAAISPPTEVSTSEKKDFKGFEKLETSGFNIDEVHNLRFHFHAMCIYSGLNEEDEDVKIQIEEKWLEGKLPIINSNLSDRSEIMLNEVTKKQQNYKGDGVDLVWGVFFGFLLTFLSLLIVKNNQQKFVSLNRLQKLGLKIGIVLSLLWVFILIKYLN